MLLEFMVLVHVELEELAVCTVGVTVGVMRIRVWRSVLFIRQKLLRTSLLELAHSGAGLLREREQLLGDFKLAHVVAADLGDDMGLLVPVRMTRNNCAKLCLALDLIRAFPCCCAAIGRHYQ